MTDPVVDTSTDTDRAAIDVMANADVAIATIRLVDPRGRKVGASGSAKRHPKDEPDAEIGAFLALARAMVKAGARAIERANELVAPPVEWTPDGWAWSVDPLPSDLDIFDPTDPDELAAVLRDRIDEAHRAQLAENAAQTAAWANHLADRRRFGTLRTVMADLRDHGFAKETRRAVAAEIHRMVANDIDPSTVDWTARAHDIATVDAVAAGDHYIDPPAETCDAFAVIAYRDGDTQTRACVHPAGHDGDHHVDRDGQRFKV